MLDPHLDSLVTGRIKKTTTERKRSRQLIAAGRPLAAEEDLDRRHGYAARFGMERDRHPERGAEAIQGNSSEFINTNFLGKGAHVARAVARVTLNQGSTALATGFMISPELFITNNHVLPSAEDAREAWIEFDYELGLDELPLGPTFFKLDPERFFLSDPVDALDFTIVCVGARMRGKGELSSYGSCPLSDRGDKHAKGAKVNIVEHPDGALKAVVLRENDVVARGEFTLHYETDTSEGSSGSPVYNDAWEVVALHHWGKPHTETRTAEGAEIPVTVNEGIRVSAIVKRLRAYLASEKDPKKRALLEAALQDEGAEAASIDAAPEAKSKNGRNGQPEAESPRMVTPSETTIIVPLEIRVRVLGDGSPAATASAAPRKAPATEVGAERIHIDTSYENRRGYSPAFLPGFPLPLPRISDNADVAPLEQDQPDPAEGELKYEHFSVKMSRKRRMAFFTATNIDGSTYIDVDRSTGLAAGAEAGDVWFDDPRMDPAFYLGQSFYSANSGTFDRGHLTRRSDPTWGTETRAIRANADTFHRTNCTPQQSLFNESTKYWQGVERYYLEFGATLDRSRMSVFQGPVLDDQRDPTFADADGTEAQVPLAFWKIIACVIDGELKVTGLLVSQEELLDLPRRGARPGDGGARPDVKQYLCSIKKIEALTRLDFGILRDHDTYKPSLHEGAEAMDVRPIKGWSDLP